MDLLSVGMCERTSWQDTSSSSNDLHISSQVEWLDLSLASVRETEANKIIKKKLKIQSCFIISLKWKVSSG